MSERNADKQTQARTCYLDVLNVVACAAVIMLHCSNYVFTNAGDGHWNRCVIVQSLFIFAVPIFLMISGANLLGYRKRYDTRTFFKKRASRILAVFIGCSILFYLIECLIPSPFGYEPRTLSFAEFVRGFLLNDINDVYWYFYAIIGLYLVTPLFSKIADDAALLRYCIIICIVVSVVFPFVNRFGPDYNFFGNFSYPYLSSWLLYYLTGYYLAHHFKRHVPTALLPIVFAGCVAVSAYVTLRTNLTYQIPAGNPYDSFYSGVFSPFEYVAICALFLLGKQLDSAFSQTIIAPAARRLSALSLGIYAIHMLPLRFLDNVFPTFGTSLMWKPLIIFVASALAVWLFRLVVKGIKKLFAHA